jgi:hypothetical protein
MPISPRYRSTAGFVAVPALAGLLPEPPKLHDAVADAAVGQVGLLDVAALPNCVADVHAGHVVHRERPHRHAEPGQRCVHLLRRGAFIDQEQRLPDVLLEHAVADESVADARHDSDLL